MVRLLRTLLASSSFLLIVFFRETSSQSTSDFYGSTEGHSKYSDGPALTEHPGGTVTEDRLVFYKNRSPYWLRNDIIVERNAEVIIEPGVVIKVEPQVGFTIRGILTAVGSESERIILTTSKDSSARTINFPDIRLVDGPNILSGRVQLRHNGKWRSVCTNSRNWTLPDMQTACRQLGFQGGTFWNWQNRQMPLKPRLLYEEPRCMGTESSLLECDWTSRQMGAGVCDYHPDLAIQCLPLHDRPLPYWRGLRFENAKHENILTLSNTLYAPTSSSRLNYVNILFGGVGRNQNATSALHVIGVPPVMDHLEIINSAYNGINITQPDSPIRIQNCTIRGNRGYGVFINSSYGLAYINKCVINENGGDGIRYVHHEERPNEKHDQTGYSDFCTLATAYSQTFPVQVFFEQSLFMSTERTCSKVFTTRYGHVLTLNFIIAETDRNNSASVEVFDGTSSSHNLLTKFSIRNNTRPQSVTTTNNQIYIRFRAEQRTNMFMYMRITSGLSKSYDLNVTNSDISDNVGRGVAFDNLRTQLHVHKSSISKNDHVAGLHVTSGVGDVNVTESRISFNEGDGINITYTGGNRNISKSSISSNKGYGVAIWLNDTTETEYIFVNQTTALQYSEIIKNVDIGVLHGNFCGNAYINISGNTFQNSYKDALEILSCWKYSESLSKLQIGHNVFIANQRIGIKISPALNFDAKLEYNHFKFGTFGSILIKTKPLEEFNVVKTKIVLTQNYFQQNKGLFVVSLGLSPYSESQYLLFTRNFVKDNEIMEPFQPDDGSVSKLNPRSRVAAPIVIASNNIDVYRNIIENPKSKYEIGSHLEDQSKVINCTFNWLGFNSNEEKLFSRIFHRYDRYNLAKINFIPYLLHNSNPLTQKINPYQLYVPIFYTATSNIVGGEIEGEETLTSGEYIVERDINIRPGGKLTLEPGVTLRFPPSIGIMVGGELVARGIEPDSIKFTLKEEVKHPVDNETIYETDTETYNVETEIIEIESKIPIRLLGGKTETEGRLQVKINNEWGTVCNYGWNIRNAALVCQQLGLTLNPDDWFMERNEIPSAGTAERILLSNIDCEVEDLDITLCKAEKVGDFENSCTHDNDVGVRCYETSWAGVRFGVLSKRSDLQYITIEKAGLLDYTTSTFKPALQMDFARHNFESIKVTNNFHDGLGVMYSDIYTDDGVNLVRNSEFSNNKGAGISFKQLGLKVFGSNIENNLMGIKHNPILSGLQQRELAGWFSTQDEELHYKPFWIPHDSDSGIIYIGQGETKFLVTSKVIGDSISRSYKIKCEPGYVIGLQLLNPIENRSTEVVWIHDAQSYNNKSANWSINRDLTVFPTTSSSYGVILDYVSGTYAIGGTVIVISRVRAPMQNVYNRIVKGPVPTLTVSNTKIRNNHYGIHASYYNRYLNELGDHFLRKANESLKFFNCEISHNRYEALFVHSPHWDLHRSNISEITFMINNSLITDNGKGVYQFSRDMRASNNLFHYVLQDDTIERNSAGGFEIHLPYVWQYNENFTHSVYMNNNTWRGNFNFGITIDGHFAVVNITRSLFTDNNCKNGLIAIKGMEKKMLIDLNKIENNNGKYMIEFSTDSQSEIIGEVPARFIYNELKRNRYLSMLRGFGTLQLYNNPTCVVAFRGVQKVKVNRNLFAENNLDYQLIAGIKTAKINNYLDVSENWWGSAVENEIEQTIFDFDDWNNHAIARFRPYLLEDSFEASHSVSFESKKVVDLDHLGGRLYEDLNIPYREAPYIINRDITVMPKTTLTISPGVHFEFGPNVGILVLGSLKAEGIKGYEITMRPLSKVANLKTHKVDKRDLRIKRELENFVVQDTIRLCQGRNCLEGKMEITNEGFLEYFNKTTLQWIPMCDPRFTERNAQVVCRELGFDSLSAFFAHDIRIEYHSNSLTRIWSWPEPLQCRGTESKYEDCPIRLNGQQFGHRHECKWNSKFVFINCGRRNLPRRYDYWGGIRFADSEFEQNLYQHRIHDVTTHRTMQSEESVLEYVNIIGAGILHNEKSPAVQAIVKSPKINSVNISKAASHGVNLISPSSTMNLLFNNIENTQGAGINILTLTGEGRESESSSFVPLKDLNIPYNLFSLIDICDTSKEIRLEERVLVYYKYDNHPVNCVKIFRSAYNVKPLGFRLLQFNLFNSTNKYGIPDFISLYDGDIYNVSSKHIGRITMQSKDEKKLFKTIQPSLSIKLFANGASSNYGFIAEVVTTPISAIFASRDVQHNISYSSMNDNREGGLLYTSVGEVNPIITLDRNRFQNNCKKFYGNFTTCRSAIDFDIQNTQSIFFRNNLVQDNQGGLSIRADSGGSATSLKGFIHNNLFVNNSNLPALFVEGRKSSPYQEVTIYRNYFTRNYSPYQSNIVLKQVVSNFTYNYVKRNTGLQNIEISGFDKVRLPIYQTTSHNGFYHNYAVFRDSRSTVVAGTAGQQYVDNIFFNPDNDYEMVTVNRSLFIFNSTLELWKTKIDATYNYWGVNESLAVSGRIKDQSDDIRLLEVNYRPYYMNNASIIDVKCPPGWDLVGDTCYIYIGAPMTFYEAREFCNADNASLPYLIGNANYLPLYNFLKHQQEWYLYSERVWVQHIDSINQCTMFAFQRVDLEDCNLKNAFICEIDPKVYIDPLAWHGDIVTVAVIGTVAIAILLIGIVMACWWSKSKYRQAQRLERRNSIRQSLHSLRSVGVAPGAFSDLSYRRKAGQLSTRSTDTLTKNSDYKKMVSDGSIDSMEKSAYSSSIEDNQSYDIYEAHNPNPSGFAYNPTIEYHKSPSKFDAQYAKPNTFNNLSFKNEGFRDNSTFASNSNYQSRAESVQESSVNDETPIMQSESVANSVSFPPSEYYNTDTLPIGGKSTSTLDSKIDSYDPYSQKPPDSSFLQELKQRIPNGNTGAPRNLMDLPTPPEPPHDSRLSPTYEEKLQNFRYTPDYNTVALEADPKERPQSTSILETDFDQTEMDLQPQMPKSRSKSEALLETNFDFEPNEGADFSHPITEGNRSKSQPLETAM